MNYYISPSLTVVRVEVIELQRQQELQSCGNWFNEESKAQEMAKKMREFLKNNKEEEIV